MNLRRIHRGEHGCNRGLREGRAAHALIGRDVGARGFGDRGRRCAEKAPAHEIVHRLLLQPLGLELHRLDAGAEGFRCARLDERRRRLERPPDRPQRDHGLLAPSRDLLLSRLIERRFEIGAAVVAEGEPGRSMFIVHSGKLEVTRRMDAEHVIHMAVLEPGDFFGEMTLIEMQNRSATVVAQSPTVLYELTARQLYTYYKADIHAYVIVMQNINRELCRRLRRADNRIAKLQTPHAER